MKAYNGFSEAQRNKAQGWLNRQWAAGTLNRPTQCCACGQREGVLDAHAEDYSEPFKAGVTDQYHLCFRCHMMVHCRQYNKAAWEKYKANIMSGMIYEPFYKRDFGNFKAQTLEGTQPFKYAKVDPPKMNVLRMLELHSLRFR